MLDRNIRINKVLRELNISLDRGVAFLKENGIFIESNPNSKINQIEYEILLKQFSLKKRIADSTISESNHLNTNNEKASFTSKGTYFRK